MEKKTPKGEAEDAMVKPDGIPLSLEKLSNSVFLPLFCFFSCSSISSFDLLVLQNKLKIFPICP
jgi:hypothetical protein